MDRWWVMAAMAALLAGVGGCAEEPKSPSRVDSTRILGLKATPSRPMPGDHLTLELLWTDPEPFCAGTGDDACGPGRICQDGRCVRTEETEVLWVGLPLAAWESSDLGSLDIGDSTCLLDRCPPPVPCEDESTCPFDGGCVDGYCVPCLQFGPVTVCCGTRNVDRFEVDLSPELIPPPDDCSPDTSINLGLVYQVQAQVCAGGRINLCPDTGSLTFLCEGEGASSASAISRIQVVNDPEDRNTPPVIERPSFSRRAWDSDEVLEVRGCLEENCADRRCERNGDCQRGQVCRDSRCAEQIIHGMGEGAIETYLEPCDDPEPCESDEDCPMRRACVEGSCYRIESAFTSIFSTEGLINPARDVFDQDGDGRPDSDLVYSSWRPPVLDRCSSVDDECSFGFCDPEAGRCVGEVGFWVVIRDGRGGQDWIERTVRIVP